MEFLLDPASLSDLHRLCVEKQAPNRDKSHLPYPTGLQATASQFPPNTSARPADRDHHITCGCILNVSYTKLRRCGAAGESAGREASFFAKVTPLTKVFCGRTDAVALVKQEEQRAGPQSGL
jgi:hypothetical protein